MQVRLTLLALLALIPAAAAQSPFLNQSQPQLIEDAETAPNVYLGLAGVAGALAAVFISGGLLYSAFGGAGLDEDLAHVKRLREQYDALSADPSSEAEKLRIASETWNAARDDSNRKAAFVYVAGFLVYTVAGGLIAAFFADGLIDAFIIGLGWTGMVSTLASRYNLGVVQQKKDEVTDKLLKKVEDLNQQLVAANAATANRPPAASGAAHLLIEPLRHDQVKRLRDDVQQVRKMGW